MCIRDRLEDKGLGFCLDEYAKRKLDAYLAGEPEEQKAAISSSDDVAGQRLTKVCSVFIPQGYRSHCYQKNWNIPFQKVNLLYGFNGSGKTSLPVSYTHLVTSFRRKIWL